jgi:hypothetical protein
MIILTRFQPGDIILKSIQPLIVLHAWGAAEGAPGLLGPHEWGCGWWMYSTIPQTIIVIIISIIVILWMC